MIFKFCGKKKNLPYSIWYSIVYFIFVHFVIEDNFAYTSWRWLDICEDCMIVLACVFLILSCSYAIVLSDPGNRWSKEKVLKCKINIISSVFWRSEQIHWHWCSSFLAEILSMSILSTVICSCWQLLKFIFFVNLFWPSLWKIAAFRWFIEIPKYPSILFSWG